MTIDSDGCAVCGADENHLVLPSLGKPGFYTCRATLTHIESTVADDGQSFSTVSTFNVKLPPYCGVLVLGEKPMSLTKYQSHKIVEAEKITQVVVFKETKCCLYYNNKEEDPIIVTPEYVQKHCNWDFTKIVGGYYVKYEDGYESWSPAEAFESGYTKVKENMLGEDRQLIIARACHEVNRAYCLALGDASQPAWEDAPDWQRQSAVLGVKLHVHDPLAGPQASHESWLEQKLDDGWVYGEVKDPEAKTHPCIVPFWDLPTDQQAKDFIFKAVVHAVADVIEDITTSSNARTSD